MTPKGSDGVEQRKGRAGYHVLAASLALLATSCGARSERFAFHEPALGTRFRLVVWAEDASVAGDAAMVAFTRLRELDAVLSDWNEFSELSRLCRAPAGEAVSVSDDLWNVLALADRVVEASGGAFDPTVGPYVRLWRRASRQREVPSEERRAEAASRVGWRALVTLDGRTRQVTLARDGMQLDLGGIAKGYIADEVLEAVAKRGLVRTLVDVGGDIAVGEPPPGGAGWRVALAEPGSAEPTEAIVVAHGGVATSGDLFRFVEIDGVRYSHIVDPRTGLGIVDAGRVSVVAQSAVTADALSSALSVMGSDGAEELLRSFGAAGRIARRGPGGEVIERVFGAFPEPTSPR